MDIATLGLEFPFLTLLKRCLWKFRHYWGDYMKPVYAVITPNWWHLLPHELSLKVPLNFD